MAPKLTRGPSVHNIVPSSSASMTPLPAVIRKSMAVEYESHEEFLETQAEGSDGSESPRSKRPPSESEPDINKAFEDGTAMFSSGNQGSGRYLKKVMKFSPLVANQPSEPSTKPFADAGSKPIIAARPSTLSSEPLVAGPRTSIFSERSRVSSSSMARGSISSVTENELQLLFNEESFRHFQPQHDRLGRICGYVLQFFQEFRDASHLAQPEEDARTLSLTRARTMDFKSSFQVCRKLQKRITILVAHWVFSGLMLALTFYALFGPDMVSLYGTREHDMAFVVINTLVFAMFFAEVILQCVGRPDYVFFPMLLDIVSLVSIFGDTWFMKGGLFSGGSQGVDRMGVARSSKMTRLTRIVRIARVTRLVPYMMKLFNRNSMVFARSLLVRKLERVCMFLDTDRDGKLSWFDLKAFYLVVLEEMRRIKGIPCRAILLRDLPLLNLANRQDEYLHTLTIESFCNSYLEMEAGKKVYQLWLMDVQQDAGVWSLTNRICDSVAMKVCVGIVFVAIAMQSLSTTVKDDTAEQILYQLHGLAQHEHSQGARRNMMDICHQVSLAPMKILFLYLDHRTYLDGGACVKEGLPIDKDPVDRMSDIIDAKNLRVSEVMQVCWPPAEICEVGHSYSAALIDTRDEARNVAMWTIIQTFSLIVLLLIFVVGFNHVITKWSKLMLLPLRKLVDDMSIMTSLELVQLDAERQMTAPVRSSPSAVSHAGSQSSVQQLIKSARRSTHVWKTEKTVAPPSMGSEESNKPKVMEELVYLQKSYEHMNQAIKAWSMYVPPAVVQCLLDAGQEATISITRVECTVLFCDIANFDEACGHLSASEVLTTLSVYLGTIADVIEANHGTFLEFIGDEVMVVFNAPNPLRDHPVAALKSALEIHEALERIPKVKASDGCEVTLKCKVGVHSAFVLAGNIGSVQRMKYGLLGDGVNLSARLKGLNSKYGTQTLTTDTVMKPILERASSECQLISRPVDLVAVKGRSEPTKIHELLSPSGGEDHATTKKFALIHTNAFRLYHQRLFSEALQDLNEVSAFFEQARDGAHDEPSRQLASRCRKHIAQPPPPEWDGVERLKAKLFVVSDEPDQPPPVPAEEQEQAKLFVVSDEPDQPPPVPAEEQEQAVMVPLNSELMAAPTEPSPPCGEPTALTLDSTAKASRAESKQTANEIDGASTASLPGSIEGESST